MDAREEEKQEGISLADLIAVPENNPIASRIRMSGEHQLLWAVMEDAIDCYLRYAEQPSTAARELFHEAEEWIESEEEQWLCSFISICRAFRIDPHYLRQGLRRRVQELRENRPAAALIKKAA
jgi:hypothetical protein